MSVTLRDYQVDAVAGARRQLDQHDSTMIVLPTGCGKTEVFVRLASEWQAGRTLVVAPTIELVDQAANKLRVRTGVAPGIEQAQRRSNEDLWLRSPFVCASKQTLISRSGNGKRYERLSDVGLVIVDECHLAATKPTKTMLDHFVGQGAKVVGVTATPERHDGVAMANVLESVAYEMYIDRAVQLGWLVAPRASCVQLATLDLSEVSTKGSRGDFKDGELAKAMEIDEVTCEIAEVTAKESVVDGRVLKTVVYCPTVAVAQAVAERLADKHHLRAEWVCGDKKLCSSDQRSNILSTFARTKSTDPESVDIVCNVGVLTTGWDFPGLEHIVMARPTKSHPLYTQILGRGTRPLPGTIDFEGSTAESRRAAIAASEKPSFKLTDLYDNAMEHKLVSAVDVLGGKMGLEAVERVRESMLEGKRCVDLEQALEEARQKIAEEEAEKAERRRREREAAERRRRQAIESKAQYHSIEVDPFGGSRSEVAQQRGIRYPMPFGKYRGSAIGEVPTHYLNWLMATSNPPAGKLGKLIRSELATRGHQPKSTAKPRPDVTTASGAVASGDDINRLLMEI